LHTELIDATVLDFNQGEIRQAHFFLLRYVNVRTQETSQYADSIEPLILILEV